MCQIIEDISLDYCNGQLFLTLIQNQNNHYLEITNRSKRLVKIIVRDHQQGNIIIKQLLPAFRKCDHYWEAHKLAKYFLNTNTFRDALFIIRTYKNRYSFEGLDKLCRHYQLKTKIYMGPQIHDEIEYDFFYDVYFKNEIIPVGYFGGYFSENFVFLINENYFSDTS